MLNLKSVKFKTLLLTFSLWPDNKQASFFNDKNFPSLGLAVLAGFLKKTSYDNFEIINFKEYGDLNVHRELGLNNLERSFENILKIGFEKKVVSESPFYQAALSLKKKYRPRLVGISISFYEQFFYALQFAKLIKSFDKNIFICLGGPLISSNIDELVKEKKLSLYIDGLVVGDGEEPLASLIKELSQKKQFSQIPNFCYKGKKGQWEKSKLSFNCTVEHLKIIPVYDGLEAERIPLRVSIGCPWGKCSFCTYRLLQNSFLAINSDNFIEVVSRVVKNNPGKSIVFYDDSFLPEQLKKYSKKILESKLIFDWDVFLLELNSGFLKNDIPYLMKKAGCNSVFFGMESMSPRILKLMGKRETDPQSVIKILKAFKKAKIEANLFVMFGFPSETKKEALMTLDFLKNNRNLFQRASIQRFCLEKNTEIFNNPKKFFINFIDKKKKNRGTRFGYYYKTSKGMGEEELKDFLNYAKEFFPFQEENIKF